MGTNDTSFPFYPWVWVYLRSSDLIVTNYWNPLNGQTATLVILAPRSKMCGKIKIYFELLNTLHKTWESAIKSLSKLKSREQFWGGGKNGKARGTEEALKLPLLGLDRRALGNPPAVRPLPRPWRERGLKFFTIGKEAPFGMDLSVGLWFANWVSSHLQTTCVF